MKVSTSLAGASCDANARQPELFKNLALQFGAHPSLPVYYLPKLLNSPWVVVVQLK